jgi:hypothetical protein
MVENAARRLGRLPARPGTPEDVMPRYVEWVESCRQAGLRRVSGRLRFHLDVLVHDALRRPVAVRLGRARHQDARFRADGRPYRKSVKAAFPAHWHDPLPHTAWRWTTRWNRGAVLQHAGRTARARGRLAALASSPRLARMPAEAMPHIRARREISAPAHGAGGSGDTPHWRGVSYIGSVRWPAGPADPDARRCAEEV